MTDKKIPEDEKVEKKKNSLKHLQEEVAEQNHFFDDHGPVILGIREKPPGFYYPKPKYKKEGS